MTQEQSVVRKEAFDALLVDPDFDQAERLVAKFNIFSAIGFASQEIRHSRFLAALLDPSGPHQLGDRFLRRFLTQACKSSRDNHFSVSDVLLRDWTGLRVRREWEHIDLLLLAPEAGFVCAIENKIHSGEHGDQLRRYSKTLDMHFPQSTFPTRMMILLSPNGTSASDSAYQPMSYMQVLAAVDDLLNSASDQIQQDVRIALRHYADLLRSEIVQHDELVSLCRRIYQRHRAAIDAVIEHGDPDVGRAIVGQLKHLIGRDSTSLGIAQDDCVSTIVRFADTTLDTKSWIRGAPDWTSSKRIVLYEFTRRPDSLLLELVVGDGDSKTRARLFTLCKSGPFIPMNREKKWHRLWRDTILSKGDFEALRADELTFDGMVSKIDAFWDRFKSTTFPALRNALQNV